MKKTAYQMGENIRTHTTHYQKHKQPNQKNGQKT